MPTLNIRVKTTVLVVLLALAAIYWFLQQVIATPADYGLPAMIVPYLRLAMLALLAVANYAPAALRLLGADEVTVVPPSPSTAAFPSPIAPLAAEVGQAATPGAPAKAGG